MYKNQNALTITYHIELLTLHGLQGTPQVSGHFEWLHFTIQGLRHMLQSSLQGSLHLKHYRILNIKAISRMNMVLMNKISSYMCPQMRLFPQVSEHGWCKRPLHLPQVPWQICSQSFNIVRHGSVQNSIVNILPIDPEGKKDHKHDNVRYKTSYTYLNFTHVWITTLYCEIVSTYGFIRIGNFFNTRFNTTWFHTLIPASMSTF